MNSKTGPCGHRIVSVGEKGSAAREYSDAGACGMCKESGCNYAVMYAGHCDKKPHFAVTLCGCQNWPVQVSKWYAQRSDAILYAKKLSEWNGIKYTGLNYSGQFDGEQADV